MEHLDYDLETTAFFPLTGNPVGFHHLVMADEVLQQVLYIKQVVFLLSNGHHPDPTKAQAIAKQSHRLEILKTAIESFQNPDLSFVATQAKTIAYPLRLNEKTAQISVAEFSQKKAITLCGHAKALLQACQEQKSKSSKIHFIIGSDLIDRMEYPHIFTQDDLEFLSKHCLFLPAFREGYSIKETVQKLKVKRQIQLPIKMLQTDHIPEAIHFFLHLSSTAIRRAFCAGHQLSCFLPTPATHLIQKYQLFQTEENQVNEWKAECVRLFWALEQDVKTVFQVLETRKQKGLPHTLAFVESSSGGMIAAAFAGIPGASQYFKESLVVYDQPGKDRLLGKSLEVSAVSQTMAENLAIAGLKTTKADYVVTETGMAGPMEGNRRSRKYGQCWLTIATPKEIKSIFHQSSPFLTKREHQLHFALAAVKHLLHYLS